MYTPYPVFLFIRSVRVLSGRIIKKKVIKTFACCRTPPKRDGNIIQLKRHNATGTTRRYRTKRNRYDSLYMLQYGTCPCPWSRRSILSARNRQATRSFSYRARLSHGQVRLSYTSNRLLVNLAKLTIHDPIFIPGPVHLAVRAPVVPLLHLKITPTYT